jgi:LmbE family N-acetylglucosaminyl deacetylase
MDRSPRLQVVVAHPDDETFGCGSLLLHAKSSGAVTAVCCATRGEEGGAAAAADLAAVRERELYEAAAVLEVDSVRLLSFADSGMSGTLPPDALCAADFDDVVAAVRHEIDAFGPDVVVTLDAGDGHRDHARIRDAAIAAAHDAGVPRVYLMCLPRSLMQRWIDQMRVDHPTIEYLDAEASTLGTPDGDITTIIDVTEHLDVRQRAIAAHASQTSPFEGLPDDLKYAFLAAIHARRVEPSWVGGDLEANLFG